MAKKKQTRTVPASFEPVQAVAKDSTPAVLAQEASRGRTEVSRMFDALLGEDDLKILKDYPSHQRQLFGVLKSLYGDEVKLQPSKKAVWAKPLLTFEVTLQALDDSAVYCQLHIELPSDYPKIAPIINVIETKPDSGVLTQSIKDVTAVAITTQLGDEYMVSNILAEIAEKLNDAKHQQEKRAQGISLEEERAKNTSAALTHAASREQSSLQQKETENARKDARLAKEIEEQRRRQRQNVLKHVGDDQEQQTEVPFPASCIILRRAISCYDPLIDHNIRFRAVQPVGTIFQKDTKALTLVCPYTAGQVHQVLFALKEVDLPEKLEIEDEPNVNLFNIETSLQAAQEFDHPAIVNLLGYQLEQTEDASAHWNLKILTEYADRGSLVTVLETGELSAVKVRTYVRSLLDALEFFDRQGYIHPAIHAHNVLFFGTKQMGTQVKLSDGYGTALRGVVDRSNVPSKAQKLDQSNWAAPELISGSSARTSKTCLWELGVVMLQMALGNGMMETYTSPEDAISRAGFSMDFDNLITRMCSTASRKRPSAFHLQSHQFFKSHERSLFNDTQPRQKGQLPTPALLRGSSTFDSRWMSEWEAVGQLGKGGFGVVYKARNRLDSHFYAVKQIKCKSANELDQIWSEVRMLAQLSHSGIVRYFGAWNEDDQEDSTETDSGTVLTDERSFAPPQDTGALASNIFGMPSTGHDLMDPSLNEISDVESSSDQDDNPFGYQSAPSGSDANDSQACQTDDDDTSESDPFAPQQVVANPGYDPFESDSVARNDSKPIIPSKPEPFKATAADPSIIRRSSVYYNRRSTLYIQMELCETGTLSHMIKNGLPSNIDESWRLFRLILDALQYIHSMGVVHRDLKPANIFIDAQRMPKIGDFGLAAPGEALSNGQKLSTHVAGVGSRGVGTKYYVAPELENVKGSGQYSAKADMFALGIIFFEMCFPFRTFAERWKWLEDLNEDASSLPPRFDDEQYKVQGRIIKSLLSHDEQSRPSAKELLLDPEIPEPLEEEKQQRFVQRLMEGEPEQFHRVIKNFMSKSATKAQSLAYAHVDDTVLDPLDHYLLDAIQCQLEQVFRLHGGLESTRGSIFPAEDIYSNAVKFLDSAGFVVQLPHDLTLPFARSIAIRKFNFMKHFCMGTVYRPREAGVEPLCIPEVDFDLVSYNARDLSLKDAQLIGVLDDCLSRIGSLVTRSFTIVISHGDLLDQIFQFCRIPDAQYESVKRILSTLNVGKTTWKQVQPQLQTMPIGLTSATVSALSQFNFAGSILDVRQKVLAIFQKAGNDEIETRATRTLNRLQEVDKALSRLQVKTAIVYEPLSNMSEVLYRGSLMFKCIESKTHKPLVVGGRYDTLVRQYETPTQKFGARAVGFRMNVKDLAAYARIDAQYGKLKSMKAKTNLPADIVPRVEVVITSFDEKTLRTTCLEVCRSVLDAGISAEVSEQHATIEELDEGYGDHIDYWLVIVRQTSSAQRAIRLRSPGRDETDVPASELIDYLREELTPRNTAAAEPVLRRARSSHGAADRDNVIILTPEHKSKKVNRAAIVDSARTAARGLTDVFNTSYKVLAIDTDDDTLHRLRNTRLQDGESWRTFRHAVPLTEREYVQTIQEQLQDWSAMGQEGAFICNYKTRTCILYDFGKS